MIENLESEFTQPKTKTFLKVCQVCQISLHQKILLILSEKTPALKLATQNLKNVEVISSSNLNTLSLLKANQIIVSSSALTNIKEIYCD